MFKVTTLDIANPPKNEDGTVDFKQDFFEKPAYLTVSGQLEGEAMALAFGKIYTFGPTFRAEKSYTQRHAAEFWMIEPEIAFADLEDDMELAEAMIKYVISYVIPTPSKSSRSTTTSSTTKSIGAATSRQSMNAA